jgi:hypothetical protein
MKRFLLVNILLLAACITLFAQQGGTSNRPSSAQTRENATQYLNEGKENSSRFDSMQAALIARNTSNSDAYAYNRLKDEIDKLEAQIIEEQNRISASLDRGIRVNEGTLNRVQGLIDQHKAKLEELEAFTTSRQ